MTTKTTSKPKEMSKTQQAIELIEHEGLSMYEAARKVGINYAVVYRAMASRIGHACPACGHKRLARNG